LVALINALGNAAGRSLETVLRHDRVRMPSMGIDDAVRELKRGAGRRFDPEVVAAAVAVIDDARTTDRALDELTLQWTEQHEPVRIVLKAMRHGQQRSA